MKCPVCGKKGSRVIDSRHTDDSGIRRRRLCSSCGRRFTTFEVLETEPVIVIKKDGSRQLFDKSKIMNGLSKACYKRPVTPEQINILVNSIEFEIQNSTKKEIPSTELGLRVLEKLKEIDEVSYVRFASVYRDFTDIESFMKELENMKSSSVGKKKRTRGM